MPATKSKLCCGQSDPSGTRAIVRKLETNEPAFFIETTPPGIAPEVYSKACAEAFGIWSKVGNIRFIEVPRVEDAIVIVTMRAITKKVMGSYILATATYPNGPGETQYIHLNSLRKWVVSASKYVGLMDVRHTLRHECGHIIGLDHNPDGTTPRGIMDRRVNKNIFAPSRREAALVAKLYGPPKRRQ